MQKLSPQQREFLEESCSRYQSAVADAPQVYEYLERTRGKKVADAMSYYRIGYVAEPMDGHEKFAGRMVIPYVTPSGVVDLRFRCIEDHDCKLEHCPKYMSTPGSKPTLFNTRSLRVETHGIAICEGEMDCLAVEQECHVPAVGYPGVSTWQKNRFWRRCFPGYQVVYVIADGDQPGMDAAQGLMTDLPNARLIQMPDGEDATTFIQEHGAGELLKKMGIGEKE